MFYTIRHRSVIQVAELRFLVTQNLKWKNFTTKKRA